MTIERRGGFLIAQIHRLAGRVFARMLKGHQIDINPAQGRILFALWEEDGIPIRELARRTSLGKSTLTSMLDRLEAAGHITRRRSTDDRRAVLVERTEKDRAAQAAIEISVNSVGAAVFSALRICFARKGILYNIFFNGAGKTRAAHAAMSSTRFFTTHTPVQFHRVQL